MTAINAVVELTRANDVGVITVNSPPVNALSQRVRISLLAALKQAADDTELHALVLICSGRTFIAGADISEFDHAPQPPSLQDVQDAIENSPRPIIAAIHGHALGGGLELALCCHHRIAVPSARCGLPEVHLGLLPGAGGTQRLPRLIGPLKALEMMISGEHVSAPLCLELGLIDALADEHDLLGSALSFARRIRTERHGLRRVRDLHEHIESARSQPQLFDEFRRTLHRRARGLLAPQYIVRCVEAAVTLPFEAGLACERAAFEELLRGPQSAAQRYVFFAERTAAKIPHLPVDTRVLPIERVGIVGAGTMGGGIAMSFANAGLPVTLVEAQQDALDRGLATIRSNYERSVRRGKLSSAEVDQRMSRLQGTLALEALAECDLIIEAVFEDMAVKQTIFRQLDAVAKPDAVLATNTSALNVDEIAAVTRRPESVLGLHFFSPANVMRLLEVVRAAKTSQPMIATAMQLAKRLGKVAILVGVCPGFVGNRMLFARSQQVNAMLLEGALPWDIDRVLQDFGMPMGPFAMADLAGLDLGWRKDTSRSASIREVLCEQGRRGQKTGAGYYDYDEQRNASPSPITEQIVRDFARRSGRPQRQISEVEILERCLYVMINEGAKILAEGIALRPSDIDIAWVHGYGWPAYRGGPMYYADTLGLDTIVNRLNAYAGYLGEDFSLAALLERLADNGQRFRDGQR